MMKNVMNAVKKHWKIILIIIVILFTVNKVYNNFFKEKGDVAENKSLSVELLSLADINGGDINTFCSIEAVNDVSVIAEASGKVTNVYVKDGQTLNSGQKILSVENIQQRVAVQNAKVSLASAELALSELLNDNSNEGGSLLSNTKNQQDAILKSSENAYFNNDLKAYPEDEEETSDAPIVSGNYACKEEGEYLIDVYGSSSDSGASIRFSGLENGRVSVSTDYSRLLGSCGLEITFPENFKKEREWIIPVPNKKSPTYFSMKENLESARSGKNITLNNVQASPEKISREKARVSQARLQLESAYDNLSKTIVRASVDGTISDFSLSKGSYLSNGSAIGKIKTLGDLELVAYINPTEKDTVSIGSVVSINDGQGVVESILPAVDSSKKIKVLINKPADLELIEGTQVSCAIKRITDSSQDSNTIPLSAVSIIGTDSYVFSVVDGKSSKSIVEIGALLGDSVSIKSLDIENIVLDARGVRDGQKVNVINN